MSPQDLLFKAQDSVPSGGMGRKVGFQLSGDCLHHCKHITFTLAGLRECDIVNLSRPPHNKDFNNLAFLVAKHISQLWITCVITSMVKCTPHLHAHL